MSGGGQVAEVIGRRFAELRPHLDERQRRLLLGAEARTIGRGGIKAVAEATGAHPDTVARGARELEGGGDPPDRTRAPGGGRKKLTETDPGLLPVLMELVDADTRGDPESPLRWTTKSTYHLADALTRAGHTCSSWVAGQLLRGAGFSLQGNAKVTEGNQHADRDAQFHYISARVTACLAAGDPVVSVDTKKKDCDALSHAVSECAEGGWLMTPGA
jgi:hypothetical protein